MRQTERRVARGYKGIGMNGLIATWYANTRGKDLEEIRQGAQRVEAEYGQFPAIRSEQRHSGRNGRANVLLESRRPLADQMA